MLSVLHLVLATVAWGAMLPGLGRASVTCCLKLDKKFPQLSRIKQYHVQKSGVCPINAVVFTTVKDVKICLDPKAAKVQKAMNFLNVQKMTTEVSSSEKTRTDGTPVNKTRIMMKTTTDRNVNTAPIKTDRVYRPVKSEGCSTP
ncbi:eotaxin-like [Denticeps clupeoides]|uniref:eotaxin-like n=1 Tax=Denticeps clupeoides TaxID=299321 RepID=UPI0010A4CB82|nr:eotaxin-like [Denticeps clupeoides]